MNGRLDFRTNAGEIELEIRGISYRFTAHIIKVV